MISFNSLAAQSTFMKHYIKNLASLSNPPRANPPSKSTRILAIRVKQAERLLNESAFNPTLENPIEMASQVPGHSEHNLNPIEISSLSQVQLNQKLNSPKMKQHRWVFESEMLAQLSTIESNA